MVIIADGRFELPDEYYYSKEHVYLDIKEKKNGNRSNWSNLFEKSI